MPRSHKASKSSGSTDCRGGQGKTPCTPSLAPLEAAQQSQREKTILPRTVPVRLQVLMPRTADMEAGGKPPDLDARQKMLAARKIRNRESAQRSNEKKKAREMKIEKDVVELAGRKSDLKKRERLLLEENQKLKERLGK